MKIDKFNKLFKVPRAMRKYIKLVVEPAEMDLILAMKGETLAVPEIAHRMGWPVAEAEAFLSRAYERHVVTKVVAEKPVGYVFDYVEPRGGEIRYAPAAFYDRLEPVTMQENWADIPEAVRKEISAWWLDAYVEKVQPVIAAIKQDPDAYFQIKQKDFILIEEALEQVEAAAFHVVLNCDCRSSELACNHMREGCIRFDDGARYTIERGLGRIVTKEECQQIVIAADRDGLMHIGAKSYREYGLFGFCNCCTCCCFPLRASAKLKSEKVYPRAHFQAFRDLARCNQCGLCVKRCPFHAFHHDGERVEVKGKKRKQLAFDPEQCYGCGLCASACPAEAIRMKPL
jgi:NAD-dependent dihydropyrimidine dehydrogenase PreA subunit